MSELRAMRMTGNGMGAIAVVLVCGAEAREAVGAMCLNKGVGTMRAGESKLTHIVVAGERVDQALVVCVVEERVELHLHGGVAVVRRVMEGLAASGARVVEKGSNEGMEMAWGETVEREFQTMIGREMLAALEGAQTETAVRLLAAQATEGLTGWARRWREKVEKGTAWWGLASEAQWVLDRSETLRFLLEPARVAIVGPPNVGKSTLANGLLGRPVSITSDVPGTTRDWVDALAVLRGEGARPVEVAVTLVDTAGVRETPDPIERESILRTGEQMGLADVVLAVVDGAVPLEGETRAWLAGVERELAERATPVVVVVNKGDREQAWGAEEVPVAEKMVRVSALRHEGLEGLMGAVVEQLGLREVAEGEVFAFTGRQRGVLERLALGGEAGAMGRLLEELVEGLA